MIHLIIVAHAPLASALAAVGRHTYGHLAEHVSAIDVQQQDAVAEVEERLRAALAPHAQVLFLADAFGATPANAAVRVTDGARARLVCGLSVPMLWRTLNRLERQHSLAELADIAALGGVQGVLQLNNSLRPQNQSSNLSPYDPNATQDQQ